MYTTTSKDVQDKLDTNCFNRTNERKRKDETTYTEQRKSKLLCKDSQVYDLVEQSKRKSFNLLNIKRKKDKKQGKFFINYCDFHWCYCK